MANATPGVQFQNNQLGFKLSAKILKNLTSKMLTAPENKIVNSDYQGDTAGNYSVYVLRNALYDPDASVLGESQTGWYNTDDFTVENSVEALDLKYIYNTKIPVPTLLTMSLPTPTIDNYAEQVSDGLARTLDRTTLGEMVSACFSFAQANSDRNFIAVDPGSATYGEDLAAALGEAQVQLDAGFAGKDITCPQEDRFAIMASSAYQAVIDSGINLNSNIGAQIQAFNKFYQNNLKDFNIFKAVPQILGNAKVRYLNAGGTPGTLAIGDGVMAICGHAVATTRATDYSVGTRIVLSTEESKTNIIPLYRWAVKTLRPWFIVIIGTQTFYASYKSAIAAGG